MKTSVSRKDFKGLVKDLHLTNTQEDVSIYNGEVKSNYENVDKGNLSMSFSIDVYTSLVKGETKIDDFDISELEVYKGDSLLSVSDCLFAILVKDIENQLKYFV